MTSFIAITSANGISLISGKTVSGDTGIYVLKSLSAGPGITLTDSENGITIARQGPFDQIMLTTLTTDGDITGSSSFNTNTNTVTFDLSLADNGVVAGTYAAPTLVIDAKGRVTAASRNTLAAVATSGSYNDLSNKPIELPTPISHTYTVNGAISPTDRLAIINSSSNLTMTLDVGTTDGHTILIKRYGSGTVTLNAVIDGIASVITLNSSSIKEVVELIWSNTLTSWIRII